MSDPKDFTHFGLDPLLLSAVTEMGYATPTPIQAKALPLLLDERSLDEERLKEIVATLGLTDRVSHLPNQLSGGQQQRVSIGRALINNPALVLADEPTGNLDSVNSKEILSLLKLSNQRYHQTLILVTHDRDIALQADRIITFGDGRIVRDEAVR